MVEISLYIIIHMYNVWTESESHSVMSKSLQPHDYSLTGSSVHGILQARILEWVAFPSTRGSSQARDRTRISYISCIGRQVFFNHLKACVKCVRTHKQANKRSHGFTEKNLHVNQVLRYKLSYLQTEYIKVACSDDKGLLSVSLAKGVFPAVWILKLPFFPPWF